MRFTNILLMASSAAAISMPTLPDISVLFARKDGGGSGRGGSSSCPAVWTQISRDLTAKFLSDGQCNPDARAAIRAVFHDCGAWNTAQGAKGGCDGSLVLAGELSLPENNGLQDIGLYLKTLAGSYGVSVADMIVFAGSHAVVTCPGGPRVKTYIGRKDSTTRAPPKLLPDVRASADDLYKLFQDKGFNAVDLAALLGAHTTSNQFHFDESADAAGAPQDSTPGIWDVKYYSETTSPPKGVVVLPSDSNLAAHATVGKEFRGFVNNAGKWNGKFADALARMELFGSAGTSGMADCTNALPSTTNAKREMRGMPMLSSRH